jgi:scyllo-inositol 2-dehydrogenase (NADP+)
MSEPGARKENVKLGVIGLGRMGLSHLSILRPHPQVEIVGISDTSRYLLDVMKRYTGLPVFRDHRELVETARPDAVVVATPTGSHAAICESILESGVGVFLEKPLALTVESGERIVELAAHKAVTTQVGYHFRFVPSFEEARRWYRSGHIGRVHHYHVAAHGPAVVRPRGTTWRARPSEGGGCLYDYASHAADLANFVFGPPDHVGGSIVRSVFSKDVDDEVYANLYYGDGLTGQLSANWSDATQRKLSVRVEIWGTGGKITADRQECHAFLTADPPADTGLRAGWNVRHTSDLVAPVRYYVRGEEYTLQLDRFVESVRLGRVDEEYSFASAHETDVVLDMIRRDGDAGGRTGPWPPLERGARG